MPPSSSNHSKLYNQISNGNNRSYCYKHTTLIIVLAHYNTIVSENKAQSHPETKTKKNNIQQIEKKVAPASTMNIMSLEESPPSGESKLSNLHGPPDTTLRNLYL